MSNSGVGDGASLSPPRQLLLLSLAEAVPRDVISWAERDFVVETVSDVASSVDLLREHADRFAVVLIYLERARVDEALRTCRQLRQAGDVPTLLASEDQVRVADRVAALEAGASDFLASPLSIVELATKIEYAVAFGPAPVSEPSTPTIRVVGNAQILRQEPFAFEVERRLSHPSHSIFTLVSIRAPENESEASALGTALLESARHEDGDCVGMLPRGFGVVLDGASVAQARIFMQRVRKQLPKDCRKFDWAAQSGMSDAASILGEFGDPRALKASKTSA